MPGRTIWRLEGLGDLVQRWSKDGSQSRSIIYERAQSMVSGFYDITPLYRRFMPEAEIRRGPWRGASRYRARMTKAKPTQLTAIMEPPRRPKRRFGRNRAAERTLAPASHHMERRASADGSPGETNRVGK
jgi:hypothetical protein